MGKGLIISGGEEGQYSVQLILNRARVNTIIAIIDAQIVVLTKKIDDMTKGDAKELEKLKRAAYEKRKEYIENNMKDDPTISAWCGDLTEDLSGDVGTVEIPGERGIVQIQPGYNGNAVYNAVRDGQLQSSVAGTPASVFWNLSMLPGWQRWMPTYRYGTISNIDIDADTCDVELDIVESSQQRLVVIPFDRNLLGISVEYMSCNASAFKDGDEVLVKLEGQDWGGAKVVGFKDNPKDCEFYIDITINSKGPEYTKSLRIVDNNGDEYIAFSTEEEPGKVGPFLGIVWPAKIYLYYKGGYEASDPYVGILFSYFKTPGAVDLFFCAQLRTGSGCVDPNRYMNCGLGSCVGAEIKFILSVERIEYLLHSTFSSCPTSPINFVAKTLEKLHLDEHTSFADNVSGHYPANCDGDSRYDSHNLIDMGIMTDEDGKNLQFSGASISATVNSVGVTWIWTAVFTPDSRI